MVELDTWRTALRATRIFCINVALVDSAVVEFGERWMIWRHLSAESCTAVLKVAALEGN